MTRIDTLAELLTRPDTDLVLVGEVGRDFTLAERALLAAALRGMEATLNAPDTQAPDHVWGDYIRARDAALAAYRSARERLAGIAP